MESFAEGITGISIEAGERHEKPGRCRGRSGGTEILKTIWMIVTKIGGILTPTLIGGIFFFAIIGVFGIWITIAGLIIAVILALITVRLDPVEADAR